MKFLTDKLTNLQPVQWLTITLVGSLLIRLGVAYWLPLTGDEAYFITWGKNLDYGYYDHPPMVGWFLSLLLLFSDAAVWLRLPGILMFSFMGWVIFRLLRNAQVDEDKAAFVAILFLLAPLNLLSVLITTDTPLILWSFISAIYFYQAQKQDQLTKYLLAGFFLGLAFYSKFFAGLLGIAYFFYIVFFVRLQRGLKPYAGIAVVLLGVAPFIILNLLWNYNNCWNNYLFNLLNRTSDAHFSFATIGLYLGFLVYLIMPPLLWYAFKQPLKDYVFILRKPAGVFIGLFVIPLFLFFLLSFVKEIGLHWLLSFSPFLFISLGFLFTTQQLITSIKFVIVFSILHLAVLAFILIFAPDLFDKKIDLHWLFSFYPVLFVSIFSLVFVISIWLLFFLRPLLKSIKFIVFFSILYLTFLAFILISIPGLFEKNEEIHKDIIFGVKNTVILDKLAAYRGNYIFATGSYVKSALLSYTSGEHVIVLGQGSHHAREDDKRTDFRLLDGKNILLVSEINNLGYLSDFFESVEIKPLKIEGATFYYALGQGFKYSKYRELIIQNTLERYYRIPEWLPTGQCYMQEMYNPEK